MFNLERMTNFALMLEKHIIKPHEWDVFKVPEELLRLAKEESDSGYPTAISHHPKHGWFGLGCGQGPYVWWHEIEYNEFEKLLDDYYFGRSVCG